jgi:hypothetical protein
MTDQLVAILGNSCTETDEYSKEEVSYRSR